MPIQPKVTRLPVVGVMGSGSEFHEELASEVGRVLAGEGVNLLTGGGGGVMEAVSRSFIRTRGQGHGRVLGILPGDSDGDQAVERPGYPNAYVEIAIHTHLPLGGITGTSSMSRNHINILSSDVIIFLPGGDGTFSEFSLAKRYRKTIAGYFPAEQIPAYWEYSDPVFSDPWDLTCWLRSSLR